MAPTPFKIAIPEEKLEQLKQKLSNTVWPDELEDVGWNYGAPLSEIKSLVEHWKSKYDWRAEERRLNETLPQFTTDIPVEGFGSLNIHFVHKRSSREDAIPLVFVHGWPGSFLEVIKILPLLTEPEEGPAFHVVAPSLPGYGFSQAPNKPGFNLEHYAEVSHKLMQQLGYTQYATQGGDWGFFITRLIGKKYAPEFCKASHTNMPIGTEPSITSHPLLWLQSKITPLSDLEKVGIGRSMWYNLQGNGYMVQQSTRPQTLGYGVADSPVGLLSWIYEKLHDWTDAYPWTPDEVITWISIYWFSRAGPTASFRIYYEAVKSNQFNTAREPIPFSQSPLIGLSFFPQELAGVPRTWSRTLGNVVFEGEHSKGGHFAAYERPEDLVGDLRKMFGKGGPAYGILGEKAKL